jgi:hypothetical protein
MQAGYSTHLVDPAPNRTGPAHLQPLQGIVRRAKHVARAQWGAVLSWGGAAGIAVRAAGCRPSAQRAIATAERWNRRWRRRLDALPVPALGHADSRRCSRRTAWQMPLVVTLTRVKARARCRAQTGAMGLVRSATVVRAHRWMASVLLLAAALPAVAAEPVLAPGEYLWMPELAPSGPVVVVVSLPEQRAHVYRNGVRIGVSTVSTGMPGHETPTGVFTILEKRREHYSNLYDSAPMPFMQRLTWDGIALHAGRLPGYPASHGCVRLPYGFSELLFATTARGMNVVIADAASHAPTVAYPGWFAPVAPGTGQPRAPQGAIAAGSYRWQPELAPAGPLTVVLSLGDGELAVLRQGVEIGRAPVRWEGPAFTGTRAWVLLEGDGAGASSVVPGRPARRWMEATAAAPDGQADALVAAVRAGQLQLSPAFATALYDTLAPGATLVVTGDSLGVHMAAQAADADGIIVLEAEPEAPVQPSGD